MPLQHVPNRLKDEIWPRKIDNVWKNNCLLCIAFCVHFFYSFLFQVNSLSKMWIKYIVTFPFKGLQSMHILTHIHHTS